MNQPPRARGTRQKGKGATELPPRVLFAGHAPGPPVRQDLHFGQQILHPSRSPLNPAAPWLGILNPAFPSRDSTVATTLATAGARVRPLGVKRALENPEVTR